MVMKANDAWKGNNLDIIYRYIYERKSMLFYLNCNEIVGYVANFLSLLD